MIWAEPGSPLTPSSVARFDPYRLAEQKDREQDPSDGIARAEPTPFAMPKTLLAPCSCDQVAGVPCVDSAGGADVRVRPGAPELRVLTDTAAAARGSGGVVGIHAIGGMRAERANLLACLDQVSGEDASRATDDVWVVALTAAMASLVRQDVPPPRRPTRTVRRRPRFACSTCRGDPRLDGPLAEADRCLSGPQ